MFQNLPPEQQQALLEQFGLAGDGADEGAEGAEGRSGADGTGTRSPQAGVPNDLQSALKSVKELAEKDLIRGGDTPRDP